jgi:iron complex outermembrane receptor protein
MKTGTSKRNAVGKLGILASAATLGAGAGTAVAAEAEEELQEVVITAEHRTVSVQDVPLSAVAFSGDMLEERGIKTFDELQYQVPSLTFTDNGNTKYVNIRGVGVSESAPNQTVGVAVHLDGAYVAREFVYGDALFDLDSVEVLRGPQGTYSGQNAAGGSIFINSKKPVIGSMDGFVNAEMSNYDGRRIGAGATITLSDTLALRVTGDLEKRGSFYNNHGVDPTTPASRIEDQPGDLDRTLARLQLLYQPMDTLELRLIHEMSDVRSEGVPYKIFPVRGSNELPSSGLRELRYDMDGHRNTSYERTTGKVDWQVMPFFKVLATASYLDSHQHFLQDLDRDTFITPTTVQNGADYTINDHYWSAEMNLVSTLDGPFEWTLGASHLDYEQNNYLNFLRYNNAQFPGTAVDVRRHTRLYFYLNNVRKNDAIFGEVGYQLTPTLQV